MKKRSLLLSVVATFGLTTASMAQVPSYLPSNGLVGWWPFNGNANDESGNGNNGIVNGAQLSTDRNGINNCAYSLNGISNEITINSTSSLNVLPITISVWFKTPSTELIIPLINKYPCFSYNGYSLHLRSGKASAYYCGSNSSLSSNYLDLDYNSAQLELNDNNWHNLTISIDFSSIIYYKDGTQIFSGPWTNGTGLPTSTLELLHFGKYPAGQCANDYFYNGVLDDIGIWNRALTQQEITDLFNSCSNDLTISPSNNIQNIGGNATFTATNSDQTPTYIWQSDLGQGFQTLNNYGNYSGVNSNTLSISNLQLSNHNQPIRAISTSGNCVDTSNIAIIQIADTCITTVFDTVLTTVTNTLIINTTLSLPAPNNENTILIYPNPASDHITIDNGNFAAMVGYSIKITNSAGQEVFLNAINQAQFYVDLSTWTGNGMYFVHLIDSQNNTVTVRKIVLQ